MTGNDVNKQKLALDFFETFIENVTFKNIHKINDSDVIFELREKDGYGMRFYLNNDSVTFRGLLEPFPTYLKYVLHKNSI